MILSQVLLNSNITQSPHNPGLYLIVPDYLYRLISMKRMARLDVKTN